MILIVKNDYMDIYTQSIYSLYTVYIQPTVYIINQLLTKN